MQRRRAAAVVTAGLSCAIALMATPSAGASGITVKVSPSKGLANNQSVTVTGKGLPKGSSGGGETWFIDECTAAVQGRMNPSTDTSHCNLTLAVPLKVSRNGTFSAKYHVTTGIIGDGYCGTPGHLTCVIGVATARGQGTVVKITFKSPPPPA